MSGLEIFKKQLSEKAKALPDYVENEIDKDKITRWADGYCDARDSHDEIMKDRYISALMLKFWQQIPNVYEKVKSGGLYDYEDCASVLFDAIATACKPEYRAWRKNPGLSAQACINQTLATRGTAAIVYESNLARNQANAPANQVRLDAKMSASDDSPISDRYGTTDSEVGSSARALVQEMIDGGKIVEAMILDAIAFDDCMKKSTSKRVWTNFDGETESCKSQVEEFWSRKLVKSLTALPADYLMYFTSRYEISSDVAESALARIKESDTTRLHRFLKKTLASAKDASTTAALGGELA